MGFIGSGVNYEYGYYYTYSSHSKITGSSGGGMMLTLGMNDSVYGQSGSYNCDETIAAVYAPSAGFYGTYDYFRGESGNDMLAAIALEGMQYATLNGGSEADTFMVGCSSNGSVNVTIEDFTIGTDNLLIWYEGGQNTTFTCHVNGNDLVINDDRGKITINLQGISNYSAIAGQNIFMSYAQYTFDGSSYVSTINKIFNEQFPVSFGNRIGYVDVPYTLSVAGDTLRVGTLYNGDLWPENYDTNVVVIDASNSLNNMLISGNWQSNSVISGSGATTIWGGWEGNDTLKGSDAQNVFWYTGGGDNVILNFATGDQPASDILNLAGKRFNDISRDDSSIIFNMNDGHYIHAQTGASDANGVIMYTDDGVNIQKMKIAHNSSSSLSYANDVNYYRLKQAGGQIVVIGSENNVWLGGDAGQYFHNVTTINGGASYGSNTLVGNTESNYIYGGDGYQTLWGGYGEAIDYLVGGNGATTFKVGKYEGNDNIYSNSNGDIVWMYDSALSDIANVNQIGQKISVGFNTGSTIDVNNVQNSMPVFQFADGFRATYNQYENHWQGA